MALQFTCQCGRKLRADEKYAGKRAKCPGCAAIVVVPSPEPVEEVVALVPGPTPAPEAYALATPVLQPIETPRTGSVLPVQVVFRPLASMTWPQQCVGCCRPHPSETLSLEVFHATKASTGSKAGGLAGGFVGAFVGGMVGAAAGLGQTTEYKVPICTLCLSRLDKRQIKALKGKQDGALSAARVDTILLTRQIRKKCVLITFRNPNYASAFREANEGLVFDSVDACRRHGGASKKVPLKDLSAEDAARDEKVLRLLRSFLPQDGLFVAPDIPPKKVANATSRCEVPPGESILALIDCTVFGSAKNALVFGREAMYFHNDSVAKTPGAGIIPYDELASRQFARAGRHALDLGGGQDLDTSGSSTSNDTVLSILQSVQLTVCGPERIAPGDQGRAEPTVAAPAPLDDRIVALLRGYLPQADLYVAPDIPRKKLAKAARACRVPPSEHILGLVNCTVFGSAKNCLLFGCHGIYFHNGSGVGKPHGPAAIPYQAFPARIFDEGKSGTVGLDYDQCLDASGSSVRNATLVEILQSIRAMFVP